MSNTRKDKIEELCIRYLDCMDIATAAAESGIEGDPLVMGTRLLMSRSARRCLKRLTDGELTYSKAIAALTKLAITYSDNYALTDFKQGKDGTGEQKYVSRLDALKLLLEVTGSNQSSDAESFFRALSEAAPKSIGEADE